MHLPANFSFYYIKLNYTVKYHKCYILVNFLKPLRRTDFKIT